MRQVLPTIFISHAHQDNEIGEDLVKDLRRDLRLGEEDDIFIDLRSLGPGDPFMHRIQVALSNHPIFIVALTPRSVHSNFVRSETNYAIQQTISNPETRLIIPLLLEPCDPTELAPLLMGYQVIDMTRDRDKGYESLLKVIRNFRERGALPAEEPTPENSRIRLLLRQAQEALQNEDWASARNLAAEGSSLKSFANAKDVFFPKIIARSYIGERRWQEALSILHRLTEDASLDAEVWHLRAQAQEGLAREGEGDFDEAIASYHDASARADNRENKAALLLHTRNLQIEAKDIEGALHTVQEEMELKKGDPALRAIYFRIIKQLPRPRKEQEVTRLRGRRNPSVQDLEFFAEMQDEIVPEERQANEILPKTWQAELEKERILAVIRERAPQSDPEQLRQRLNLPSRDALPWEGIRERAATINRLGTLGFRLNRSGDIIYIEAPLCPIDAGSFRMGSSLFEDPKAFGEEEPAHEVIITNPFHIGQFPVTVAEYAAFVRMGGPAPRTQMRMVPQKGSVTVSWQSQLDRLDHPVVCVQWYEAVAYTRWLSIVTGKPWRLPTEAEWEKAARWDHKRKVSHIYPWGDHWDASRCNTRSGRSWVGTTTPVDQYDSGRSSYDVWDMAGNVWEWTTSMFWPYPYPESRREREDIAPQDQGERLRVLRGGAWLLKPRVARCACRNDDNERAFVGYFFDVGFRLVLDDANT